MTEVGLFRTITVVFFLLASPLWAFDTTAKAAYVVDLPTQTVLLTKNGQEPVPPASMSKLMTLFMVFEAVRDGKLRLDQRLAVSQNAMSLGGSTMFLDTTDRVKVEDLIRGIVILSGNDACIVVAEALSPDGTEEGFARAMTKRAKEIGMTASNFRNASGWPQEGHVMSMQDLVVLAERLMTDFPQFYPLFSETEFAFDGRAPSNRFNRNPLLTLNVGADGLKTGSTLEAGFGLVGSVQQQERRVIFAITGLPTAAARKNEAERLVNWSMRQFQPRNVAQGGAILAEVPVWIGEQPSIGIGVQNDFVMALPVDNETLQAELSYMTPLKAPITAGQEVGEMTVTVDGMPQRRVALVAMSNVDEGGFLPHLRAATTLLMERLFPPASPSTQ